MGWRDGQWVVKSWGIKWLVMPRGVTGCLLTRHGCRGRAEPLPLGGDWQPGGVPSPTLQSLCPISQLPSPTLEWESPGDGNVNQSDLTCWLMPNFGKLFNCQTPNVDPILVYSWANVEDGGPALTQLCLNIWCNCTTYWPCKHNILTQCWFNVWSSSATLVQH